MNQFYLLLSVFILPSVNLRFISCKASISNSKIVLSCSKQKEVKKTKTAPISLASPTFGLISPSVLVSPPVDDSSTSPGPYFVKSLTTSMTLDRRKGSKKLAAQPLSGAVSPRTMERKLSSPGERTAPTRSPPICDKWSCLVGKNVMSKSDPGAGAKKSPVAPISKIALLSSFFERKAKQAATGEKEPKFHLAFPKDRSRQPNL